MSGELAGPAVLTLALLAYVGASGIDGNGFVAAFVGGLVFGNAAGRSGEKEVYFVDQSGAMASMISWLVFGALAVPVIGDAWSRRMLVYAVLSLTARADAARCAGPAGVPVSIASASAFVGWFGRRGLASVIFALIALESLPGRRPGGRGGHLAHDPAQRARPRLQRGPGGQPLPGRGTDRAGGGHPPLRPGSD